MHLAPIISDLALILGVAGIASLIFKRIRQPVILGYLVAGMIVGPFTPPYSLISDLPNIKVWAELGVIFLMFSLGLEFSFRKLTRVGATAGIASTVEVSIMLALGYIAGRLLGWTTADCLFLAAMMAISSTTIIIKSLDELKLKSKKFADVVFGILIVEDLYAILLLVTLTTLASTDSFSGMVLLSSAAKLGLVVGSWFIVGYFLVPRFMKHAGSYGNDEMLTIISVGLCLALVAVASHFQYSVALGAFIMGSIIAESSESHRIEHLVSPLKNIFAAIFFVSVGMLIDPNLFITHWQPILILTFILIVGKIFAVVSGALICGQPLKTSVQVGHSLANVGEFSFIIAGLGITLGVTSDFLYPVIVAVSLITTLTTPFLMRSAPWVADLFEKFLPQNFLNALDRYTAWHQNRQADQSRRKQFRRFIARWLVNGVVTTLIFIVASDYLTSHSELSNLVSWLIAVALASPFIWAMLSSSIFFGKLTTFILIGVLSLKFFTLKYAFLLVIAIAIVFFVIFYKQLEASYAWFEERFLDSFQADDKEEHHKNAMTALAPWDAHLVKIHIHPNAAFTGKRLMDVELRNKFGLNVVAIQRGLQSIVAPKPDEYLYPKDELLVLSTDDKVDLVRPFLEGPSATSSQAQPISQYQMKSFRVPEGSALAGVIIRNSGIREKFGAMVVGIEREQKRVMNPNSDLILAAGDILWLVGSAESISLFQNMIQNSNTP